MNKLSLRRIKREATAHALAQAAFELTLQHGLDGFVVEDVAQRAGYSRRTFANHYSCKEEAVAMAAVPFHGIEEAVAIFNNIPESSTPLDVMYQFMKLQLTEEIIQKMLRLVTLSKEHPTLEPYMLTVFHRLATEAQQVLNDLFKEHYPAIYSHVLTGAVTGAIFPLFDGTLQVVLPGQSMDEVPGAESFDQYLDTVFGYLRNGL
ncbi:TetR family transcriptional regulator [Paenibacillus herberti]|uniref:TetR family transcriptional regulator n=2 Tax=Paenibacillus herberti TaxID=1619309 RepID=A0A229NVE5_9BACL|nr:TetR family transcriptional regulator [Paenibacillus herberti]